MSGNEKNRKTETDRALARRVRETCEKANIEDRPFTPAAKAIIEAAESIRGFRYFIEVGGAAEVALKAGHDEESGQEFFRHLGAHVVERLGLAECLRFSDAYAFDLTHRERAAPTQPGRGGRPGTETIRDLVAGYVGRDIQVDVRARGLA